MKLKLLVLATASALLSTGVAVAQQSAADLMKAKGCMNCHDVETKKMAPSFKEISAKFANDKDAVAKVSAQLKEGKGHMKVNATDDEIKTMVESALSHK